MDKKILIIERIYDAPIEKVWQAITNKDEMKDWYFEVADFQPEVGFEFQFYGENDGRKYLHKCRVVEAEPITKIAYTWRYDGYMGESLVTFELFSEEKNKTRLKLTHSDLDSFPASNPDFAPSNFNQGWNNILGDSLRNFVETDSFIKSVRINASPEDIWNILLNPDNTWGLAFGGGSTAETDWSEGSPIIWRDTENNIGATGIVEVHQHDKHLQLHYYDQVERHPASLLGEYYEKFKLDADKTENILSVEVGKMAKVHIVFHQEMWENSLGIIKKLAEKNA